MKLTVDQRRCEGHGMCEEAAPELFRLDGKGDMTTLYDVEAALPADQREPAVHAARLCPVGVLKLTGGIDG
ncbi:ferredoxin [Streptomyces sp. Je 1-79]|uniref:ferredoxin n=1 Tax=Streptomyces sp. Je 1-79 TaxID=2943847 RepID=UPI0021A51AEE|nr:ferredoxin [Streptomyces sp. Je 1-79]MCT4356211.1 ferredoxin [Streptomyces sp. Je 1-79]